MPNQENYVQLVPGNPQVISISRLAEGENDTEVIVGRLPGQFGFDIDDNLEMHFYDSTNSLVGSVIIPISTGIVSGRTISLPDGTTDEKIVVDMTRVQKELGLLVPPGTYTVSINLFSNEIGAYTNPKMIIEEVSPSRTELRLGFVASNITDVEVSELFEFTQPSVPRIVAAGLVADTLGVESPTGGDQAAPGPDEILGFTSNILQKLEDVDPDIIAKLADLQPDAVDNLTTTIQLLYATIYDEFISLLETTKNSKEFDRLQESELLILVQEAVDRALINTNLRLFTGDTVFYTVPVQNR